MFMILFLLLLLLLCEQKCTENKEQNWIKCELNFSRVLWRSFEHDRAWDDELFAAEICAWINSQRFIISTISMFTSSEANSTYCSWIRKFPLRQRKKHFFNDIWGFYRLEACNGSLFKRKISLSPLSSLHSPPSTLSTRALLQYSCRDEISQFP